MSTTAARLPRPLIILAVGAERFLQKTKENGALDAGCLTDTPATAAIASQ